MLCFFLGHRDATDDVRPALVQAVERSITQHGVTEFVVGHYGSFDRMASSVVRAAKVVHPIIKLTLLLPYYTNHTANIGEGYDGFFYPEGQEAIPKRAAIVRANRYMIDHCDYLILYARHIGSNSREFLEYAQRRFQRTGKPQIINLGDWDN